MVNILLIEINSLLNYSLKNSYFIKKEIIDDSTQCVCVCVCVIRNFR